MAGKAGLDRRAQSRFQRREGATLLAYGLVVGLIAVVALGTVTSVGGDINTLFGEVSGRLGDVANPGDAQQDGASNQAPTAGDFSGLSAFQGMSETYAASLLLSQSGAVDAEDGTSLSVTAVGGASSGTVTMSAGDVVFTPGSSGMQSFQVTFADSAGASVTVTASVDTASSDAGAVVGWGGESGPNQIPSGQMAVSVAASHYAGCAIEADASITCWGSDTGGAVSGAPSSGRYVQISGARQTFCVRDSGNQVTCWGDNTDNVATPPAEAQTARSVRVGQYSYACVIPMDRSVFCWGSDTDGQASPPALSSVDEIAVGAGYGCARQDDNAITCWGRTEVANNVPSSLAVANSDVVSLVPGRFHMCALLSGNQVTCWGRNDYSQAAGPFSGVAGAGSRQATCVIESDGDIECYGSNAHSEASHPSHDGTNYRAINTSKWRNYLAIVD